jgi:hypothetical protein
MTGSQGTVAAGDYLEAQITAPAASAGSYYSAAATSNGSLPAFNLANVVGVSAGTSVSITFYEVDVAGNRNATSVAQTFVDRS